MAAFLKVFVVCRSHMERIKKITVKYRAEVWNSIETINVDAP